ncbi:hypothetical protein [Streptomyces rugosispiralis]|uniref:Integral membrane protein n=1 Tax=Streptomyces rugosispiralis TaxID=2967341 RepID=A0ABT1UP83_9ACTN|nr:hypothetical protein [Streptomyces rugosispiralis]MCQ8186941.1 hypothetical protein [Streptomyces rugosispiralis]
MDAPTLRAIAGALAMAGLWGIVAMSIYKAGLRRVDWSLIPASAMPRVRWWSTHASCVLRLSLTLAGLGLTVLGLADLATT